MSKRNNYVDHIRLIYTLAQRNTNEPEIVPQLLVLVEKLGGIWSSFTTEDDAFLDCLIELDLLSEYTSSLGTKMRELIIFSMATVNFCLEYNQSLMFVHVRSREIRSQAQSTSTKVQDR